MDHTISIAQGQTGEGQFPVAARVRTFAPADKNGTIRIKGPSPVSIISVATRHSVREESSKARMGEGKK